MLTNFGEALPHVHPRIEAQQAAMPWGGLGKNASDGICFPARVLSTRMRPQEYQPITCDGARSVGVNIFGRCLKNLIFYKFDAMHANQKTAWDD